MCCLYKLYLKKKKKQYIYLYIYLYCVGGTHVKVRGQLCKVCSLSTMWVTGFKLRSLGLAGSPLPLLMQF